MGISESRSVEPLIEPLTRREREILGLLAEGHSAPEIAGRLVLAVSSVKWHIQQLYGKLGVNNKQRAIVRATELGLLGAIPGAPSAQATPKHNLPLQVTHFFGRETEISQIKARLAEHRLVTLAGSGGVGKTRLALRAAEELVNDFDNGVWFVGLAPVTDPALVAQTVTASLGLRDEPGRPILDTLIDFLRSRQALLVLDNCEHLLEACAQVADQLLRACPRLTILASSREPLGIEGEAVFAVPSLQFRGSNATPTPGQLAEYDAVRLFIDRARLLRPEFAVTAENATVIARICQRLDGIPLALELAAARLNVLSAEQLSERLEDAFKVLTGGSRTAPPRQQTLRATLDWSYRLLDAEQRLLLQRLAVFAGGCTLEAAESVCAGEGLEAGQVVEALAGLVVKSLVLAEHQEGKEPRYQLLETVRQYAREKLYEAGEGERLRARHRDYFLTVADETGEAHFSGVWHIRARKLAAEVDNVRLGLNWSLGDLAVPDAVPRLVIGSLYVLPSPTEQKDWCIRGVAWCESHSEVSATLLVRLLVGSWAATNMDDVRFPIAWCQRAVEISRGLGSDDDYLLALSLAQLVTTYLDAEDASGAIAHLPELEQVIAIGRFELVALPQKLWLVAHASLLSVRLAFLEGRYPEVIQRAGECAERFRELDDHVFAVGAQHELAFARYELGNYEQARLDLMHSLTLMDHHQGFARQRVHAYAQYWLAKVDVQLGMLERAMETCRAGIQRADRIPDRNIIAGDLGQLAIIYARLGSATRAARLAGASAALWAKQKRKPWDDTSLDTLLPGWRESPHQPAISAAYEAGLAMSNDEAVADALSDDDGTDRARAGGGRPARPA